MDRSSSRRRAVLALSLAVPLGFVIGRWLSRAHLGIAAEIAIDGFAPLATAAFAAVILRTADANKLWTAAVLLVLPVIGTHYARAQHPIVILAAEASWFFVLLCCARTKRTLGVWCIVACAACTTGIQLTSSAAKHEAAAAP